MGSILVETKQAALIARACGFPLAVILEEFQLTDASRRVAWQFDSLTLQQTCTHCTVERVVMLSVQYTWQHAHVNSVTCTVCAVQLLHPIWTRFDA
jgi:hypothetical protein